MGHCLYRAIRKRKLSEFTELDMELEGFGMLGVMDVFFKGYPRPLTPANFVELVFGQGYTIDSTAYTFIYYFFPL